MHSPPITRRTCTHFCVLFAYFCSLYTIGTHCTRTGKSAVPVSLKIIDISLLRSIPYILTAKNDIHICMPMGEASCLRGNNDDFFTSVASLTALYANKVTYLYLCEKQSNSRVFEAKIRAIRNYLNYRGKTCDIDIKLFFVGLYSLITILVIILCKCKGSSDWRIWCRKDSFSRRTCI